MTKRVLRRLVVPLLLLVPLAGCIPGGGCLPNADVPLVCAN